jgi:hypothetical protein
MSNFWPACGAYCLTDVHKLKKVESYGKLPRWEALPTAYWPTPVSRFKTHSQRLTSRSVYMSASNLHPTMRKKANSSTNRGRKPSSKISCGTGYNSSAVENGMQKVKNCCIGLQVKLLLKGNRTCAERGI